MAGYGVSTSPFAPAQQPVPAPAGAMPAARRGDDCPTGPNLGKGSELLKVWSMPNHMGHADGVNCLHMVNDKIYSGGRDEHLITWKAFQGRHGLQLTEDQPEPIYMGSSVTSMFFEPASQWLFCGLYNGTIAAFCKDPCAEDKLVGHRRFISSLTVHSGVLVSGSWEGAVRFWTYGANRQFNCHPQPLQSPVGPVTSVRVLGDSLWVGGQTGITCIDLNTLQPKGTIHSHHQVMSMIEFEGYMLASFRNGDVKIYDKSGVESYAHPSRGEHTSNTAMELMVHPIEKKPMLLCGQTLGYVTAYDLPDFRPRGSWVCMHGSDVKAILDAKVDGMFFTAGTRGDIMIWQWVNPSGAQRRHPVQAVSGGIVTNNPFAVVAPATPVVSNPFAPTPQAAAALSPGACCGAAAANPAAAAAMAAGCGALPQGEMML